MGEVEERFLTGRAPYPVERTLLTTGREAVAEVNTLAEAKDVNAPTLYDPACVYSLSSAAVKNDAKLVDRYATRAVELLRQAVAKGFKDAEHLKKDTDLDPLRSRDDYKQLLQELQPKPKQAN
jgi:hypothetical protein